MRYFGPVLAHVIGFVADRVRRLAAADDRGAMFYRYGVPLLVVAMLAIAFTDVEDDVVYAVQTIVDTVRGAFASRVEEG